MLKELDTFYSGRDWREGPFLRGHKIYKLVYDFCKEEFGPCPGVSTSYEGSDMYGGFWATLGENGTKSRLLSIANTVREKVNTEFGYNIIPKPDYYDSTIDSWDDSPYFSPSVFLGLLPKSIAQRNDRFDGDAVVGAVMSCVEAGIVVKL